MTKVYDSILRIGGITKDKIVLDVCLVSHAYQDIEHDKVLKLGLLVLVDLMRCT